MILHNTRLEYLHDLEDVNPGSRHGQNETTAFTPDRVKKTDLRKPHQDSPDKRARHIQFILQIRDADKPPAPGGMAKRIDRVIRLP